MPMQSQAQRAYLWANHPEIAKRWEKHTPKGKKLPEHAGDGEKKRAFAAAFVTKCAAAGITAPADVARAARALAENIKRANSTGDVVGGAISNASFLPLIGSVIAPAAAGFGVGALGGYAKNKADEDDAETMRLSAQANAYRRRAAVMAAHAQVRKLTAKDPGKYVVLG